MPYCTFNPQETAKRHLSLLKIGFFKLFSNIVTWISRQNGAPAAATQMNIVFDLPTVHQIHLFCEWLELADVARLDSALCCQKLRADFLALLCDSHTVFEDHTFEHDESGDARWVITRKVKIRAIYVFSDIVTNDELCMELMLNLSGPSLESVTLSTYPCNDYDTDSEQDITICAELFIMVINSSCPNLTAFYIESKHQDSNIREELLVKMLTRCKKLKVFVLQNCNCGSNALLLAVCTAPNLESITLSGGCTHDRVQDIPLDLVNHKVTNFDCKEFSFYSGSDSMVCQMCMHFPNLERLEATELFNADVSTISQHCPLMQDITVSVSETIEWETTSQVARNWPHLHTLSLHLTMEPLPVHEDEEDALFGQSCSEGALLCFIRHCPQLVYVNALCRMPTYENSCRHPAKGDTMTEGVGSQLYELYVDSLSVGAFNEIQTLCKRLHTLVIHHEIPLLYIDQAGEEDDDFARPIETALHHIKNSSIKILSIRNYDDLTGSNIQRLAGLEGISFSNPLPHKMKDQDILKLVSRCPDLRKLVLLDCFPVQEGFLLPLLDQCPTLTSLTIRNSRREGDYMRHTSSVQMLQKLVQRLYLSWSTLVWTARVFADY